MTSDTDHKSSKRASGSGLGFGSREIGTYWKYCQLIKAILAMFKFVISYSVSLYVILFFFQGLTCCGELIIHYIKKHVNESVLYYFLFFVLDDVRKQPPTHHSTRRLLLETKLESDFKFQGANDIVGNVLLEIQSASDLTRLLNSAFDFFSLFFVD